MIVEIITVGDELLTGKVTDTNSCFLSRKVMSLGFKCLYRTTVGDNKEHIHNALRLALSRADVILFTGGLGPTDDDLTIDAIASYFNAKLVFHENIAEYIRGIFHSRKFEMPESNLKQAYIPEGALVLHNPIGTAPGIYWQLQNIPDINSKKYILTFPGVPYEMVKMWEDSALQFLKPLAKQGIYEKYVNFFGIGESALVELVNEYINLKDPVVLPYANNFQVQLRVFSEHENPDEAKNSVEEVINKISHKAGKYIFGYNEDTLESAVANLLFEQNKTIALAESCTGGLVSSRLTDISGSSKYILLNMVTYSNEAKINVLGVPEEFIINHGAVSPQTAGAMAECIRKIAKTDIGVGVTGIAGPAGGSQDKPVGTVYIGISINNDTIVQKMNTNPNFQRSLNKWAFSQFTLNEIRKALINL